MLNQHKSERAQIDRARRQLAPPTQLGVAGRQSRERKSASNRAPDGMPTNLTATNHPSEYMAACCILLAELLGPPHAFSERLCTRIGRVPCVCKTGYRVGTFWHCLQRQVALRSEVACVRRRGKR